MGKIGRPARYLTIEAFSEWKDNCFHTFQLSITKKVSRIEGILSVLVIVAIAILVLSIERC